MQISPEVKSLLTSLVYIGSVVAAAKLICSTITDTIKAARRPNDEQNARLDALEEEAKKIHTLEEGNRVTQQALFALIGHALDGNNIHQLEEAKDSLQNHLINK